MNIWESRDLLIHAQEREGMSTTFTVYTQTETAFAREREIYISNNEQQQQEKKKKFGRFIILIKGMNTSSYERIHSK